MICRPPTLVSGAIFDMDGVLTDTATVHAVAWKTMFDQFLADRAARSGGPFLPFILETDYPSYVDGLPREEGIRSFLSSRGVTLALGEPTDGPEVETLFGLGNRKQKIFSAALRSDGVRLFESSVRLVHELLTAGIPCAVASSSKNCPLILECAGIDGLFQARVDGSVAGELGLSGKPSPDMFWACAARLNRRPAGCVVFEDAISGVQAGRDGGFGLVVGVDRTGDGRGLAENGADVVVQDLAEVSVEKLDQWFVARTRAS